MVDTNNNHNHNHKHTKPLNQLRPTTINIIKNKQHQPSNQQSSNLPETKTIIQDQVPFSSASTSTLIRSNDTQFTPDSSYLNDSSRKFQSNLSIRTTIHNRDQKRRRISDDNLHQHTTVSKKLFQERQDGHQEKEEEEETLNDMIIKNVMKAPSLLPIDFLASMNQADITDHVREVVVDWLMEVADEFQTQLETIALAIQLLDRCLYQITIPREKIQLVGAVCLLIACKTQEVDAPLPRDIVYICDHSYSLDDVITMEATILSILSFRVIMPTPFTIISRLCEKIDVIPKEFEKMVEFSIRVGYLNDQLSSLPPGHLAIGAIFTAMNIYSFTEGCLKKWPKFIQRFISYEEAKRIADCIFITWKKLRQRMMTTTQPRWIIDQWESMCVIFDGFTMRFYSRGIPPSASSPKVNVTVIKHKYFGNNRKHK